MNIKTVAIITRTKDRPILLKRAYESVKGQTYKDFVWVIVNDVGKKEHVDAIAASAKNDGIEVIVVHRESSVGMESATNAGIEASDSKYIHVHDDDDTLEPTFLEETVEFLENDNLFKGVITLSTRVDEKLTDEDCIEVSRKPYNPQLRSVYIADVSRGNPFSPISFIYERHAHDEIGLYNEKYPVLGDWDFCLRFLEKYDIGVIPELLANYHFRVEITDDNNVYGNTVVSGISKHVKYDAIVRNNLLRRDFQQNKIGIGFFVNLAQLQKEPLDILRRINSVAHILKRVKRFIPGL